jgi:hypothetical protein
LNFGKVLDIAKEPLSLDLPITKGVWMAFKPNYRFERAERDRAKASQKRRQIEAAAGTCVVAAGTVAPRRGPKKEIT